MSKMEKVKVKIEYFWKFIYNIYYTDLKNFQNNVSVPKQKQFQLELHKLA